MARQSRRVSTPLGALVDIFQVRQYFNVLVGATNLAEAVVRDVGFVNAVRRAVLGLPFDHRPGIAPSFPPAERHLHGIGRGRLGLVATGGSGALATIIGVVRAVEEAAGRSACIRCAPAERCSGFRSRPGCPARRLLSW